MARVEMNTTRVGELRDSLEGVVTDQGLVDVNRRMADIDRAITAAVVLAQNPDTELEARTALVDVLTRTQKLIVFMTDLEVREQVGIEAVVPVVLTDEEVALDRSNRTAELIALIAQITAVIDLDEAGDLTEKLIDTSEKLAIAQEELLQTANYSAFVTLSDNAITLAKDSLILVEQQGVEVAVGVGTSTDAVLDDEIKDTASSTDEVLDENTQEEVVTGTEESATTTPVEIDTL
jgi:hypothetical protein